MTNNLEGIELKLLLAKSSLRDYRLFDAYDRIEDAITIIEKIKKLK